MKTFCGMLLVLAAPILYLIGVELHIKEHALVSFVGFLYFTAIVGIILIAIDGLVALRRRSEKGVSASSDSKNLDNKKAA